MVSNGEKRGEVTSAMRGAWILGVLTVLVGVLVSALVAWQQAEAMAVLERARAKHAGDIFIAGLARRIDIYTEIAFGLRGLFVADPKLDRSSFFDAVNQLDVQSRYPGIKNLAFTRYVTAAQREAFETAVRADTSVEPNGYPDFAIRPQGERAEYFVADYIWPIKGNEGVLGLDVSVQPTNLQAMRYARNTGNPVASGPFDLLQETTRRTGFVILVPVFVPNFPSKAADKFTLDSVAKPNGNFLGAVAVTVRVFDLIAQLEKEGVLNGLHLTLADHGLILPGIVASDIRPLFSSSGATLVSAVADSRRFDVHGRTWVLEFRPVQSFLSPSEQRVPLLILATGSSITLLLAALLALLVKARAKALVRVAVTSGQLKESEAAAHALMANLPAGVLVVQAADAAIVDCNAMACAVLGLSRDQVQGRAALDPAWRLLNEDRTPMSPERYPARRVLATGVALKNLLTGVVRADRAKPSWLLCNAFPLLDTQGRIERVVVSFIDVTERREAEEAILETRNQLAATLAALPDSLFEIDIEGRYCSSYYQRRELLSAPPGEIVGKRVVDVLPPAAAEVSMAALAEALETGFSGGKQIELPLPQGATWFELSVAPKIVSPGATPKFIVLSRDITERKAAEFALQASLQDKVALLKEVHHRVKNNLQVIISLLRLEHHRNADAGTRAVLKDMQNRIYAMAFLHESLYRSHSSATVDLAGYLSNVAHQLVQTLALQAGDVRLRLDLTPVEVEMDQAITCGLLFNELISNCLKHAFPAGRGGEVIIELQAIPGTPQLRLRVSDTGVGLPADFERRRQDALGLQLVADLSGQIQGRLSIGPGPAAVFEVTFTRTSKNAEASLPGRRKP